MKKQQNNGGFSLLEVILAMAILAILSIPLLSYFTQSMKYNAMMADKQHATNLAQEVMEDLKKQPQLVEPVSAGGFTVPYLTGYVQTGYTPAAAGGSTTAGEVSYYGAADAIGQKYDVEVKVSTDVPENTALMPQMDGIDDTKDVVAAEGGQLQEALTYFSAENAQYAGANNVPAQSESEIEKNLKRTISITVEPTHVLVACSYACENIDGVDPAEVYTCNEFAEEDMQNIEHIYLMYNVKQDRDALEIRCAAGVAVPKLIVVCQNISEVNAKHLSYQLVVSPKDGCKMPAVASNLGNKSYPDDPAATTNAGNIYQDSYLLSVAPLVESKEGVRKVNLQVSVYKKGKGNSSDKETYRYITVNSAKGE